MVVLTPTSMPSAEDEVRKVADLLLNGRQRRPSAISHEAAKQEGSPGDESVGYRIHSLRGESISTSASFGD